MGRTHDRLSPVALTRDRPRLRIQAIVGLNMWFLFLILIAPSVPGETVLNQFETYEACQLEAHRITDAFIVSYPGDADYRLTCRFQE